MFGLDSIWHWVVVLVIVLLFFGTGKLRHAGSDLGAAIRDFKKGMRGEAEATPQLKVDPAPDPLAGDASTQRDRAA